MRKQPDQPVTLERLLRARAAIAYAMTLDGAVYAAVFERLECEIAAMRAAMQSLDLIHSEIAFGASLADLPHGDREMRIEGYLEFRAEADHLTRAEAEQYGDIVPAPDLAALNLEQERGVGFLRDNPDVLARLLKRQTGDYRKDSETALVVEPALDLLETIGFTPSKKLPRKAFFDALFELLGIEQRRRPKPANIIVIVHQRKKRSQPVAT